MDLVISGVASSRLFFSGFWHIGKFGGGKKDGPPCINLFGFRESPQPKPQTKVLLRPRQDSNPRLFGNKPTFRQQSSWSTDPCHGIILEKFLTTGTAYGNRTRVPRLHVQRADHCTMAEEWGLHDLHSMWRSKSGEEHCNSRYHLSTLFFLSKLVGMSFSLFC